MSTTTEQPTTLPLDKLVAWEGNPRHLRDSDDDVELLESIRVNGILQPLVVAAPPPGQEEYIVLAGNRRLEAATKLELSEVPVYITEQDAHTVSLVENVIRADLAPIDEARAYQQMIDSWGEDVNNVSRLTGRDPRIIRSRLALLQHLPEETQERVNNGTLTLEAADVLVGISQSSNVLADVIARQITTRDTARRFVLNPAEFVEEVLNSGESDVGTALYIVPAQYPISAGYSGLTHNNLDDFIETLRHGQEQGPPEVERFAALVEEKVDRSRVSAYSAYSQSLNQTLRLSEEDIDAARAYGGVLLEVKGLDSWGEEREDVWVVDMTWLADRLTAKLEAWEPPAKMERSSPAGGASPAKEKPTADDKQAEREARAATRRRNQELFISLAKWQPEYTPEGMRLLSKFALRWGDLRNHSQDLLWSGVNAMFLCQDWPTRIVKATGEELTVYPRGDERNEWIEARIASVQKVTDPLEVYRAALRLILSVELVDTTGIAQADAYIGGSLYGMADDPDAKKLITQAAPASVKKHRKAKAEG